MPSNPPKPQPDVPVRVKRLPHGAGLDLPAYATEGAAGMDVVSAEDLTLTAAFAELRTNPWFHC